MNEEKIVKLGIEPKAETMWIGWNPVFGFWPTAWGVTKKMCQSECDKDSDLGIVPRRVRIVPVTTKRKGKS